VHLTVAHFKLKNLEKAKYLTGSELMPGVIAAILTFGDRINLYPHIHFLVTEGEVDEAGVFHKIPWIDDSRLASSFGRQALADLVRKERLSPGWAERFLSWRHTGFSGHSRVRGKTRDEAERVGKYLILLLLPLERLSLDEKEGKVCYRRGKGAGDLERMQYLELIARVTSHILDKGQVMVRYYGCTPMPTGGLLLFFAQLEIRSLSDLTSLTMGRSKTGA
jgi:hypothetical protein